MASSLFLGNRHHEVERYLLSIRLTITRTVYVWPSLIQLQRPLPPVRLLTIRPEQPFDAMVHRPQPASAGVEHRASTIARLALDTRGFSDRISSPLNGDRLARAGGTCCA